MILTNIANNKTDTILTNIANNKTDTILTNIANNKTNMVFLKTKDCNQLKTKTEKISCCEISCLSMYLNV